MSQLQSLLKKGFPISGKFKMEHLPAIIDGEGWCIHTDVGIYMFQLNNKKEFLSLFCYKSPYPLYITNGKVQPEDIEFRSKYETFEEMMEATKRHYIIKQMRKD